MKKNIIKIVIISLGIIIVGVISYFVVDMFILNKGKEKKSTSKKEVETEYICNDGYTLENDECIMEIDSTEPIRDLSCGDNFSLQEDKCIAYRKRNANVNWNCPDGYTMRKERYPDICYKTTIEPLKEINRYCDYPYVLDTDKCFYVETVAPVTEYLCSNNFNYDYASRLCISYPMYSSCPSGTYLYSGSGKYKVCAGSPITRVTCPSNSTKNGDYCVVSVNEAPINYVYGCEAGTEKSSDGKSCIRTEYETPSYSLYCDSDEVLDGEACVKTITLNATVDKTYCPDGYKLKKNRCVKYDIQDSIIKTK